MARVKDGIAFGKEIEIQEEQVLKMARVPQGLICGVAGSLVNTIWKANQMVSNFRGKLGMDGISKPHDYNDTHDSNAISEGPEILGSLSRCSAGTFQTNLSYMAV